MEQRLDLAAEWSGECAVVDGNSQPQALQDVVVGAEPFGPDGDSVGDVNVVWHH